MAGGLINATFSNATELLVLVSAVRHNLVAIEQVREAAACPVTCAAWLPVT